MDPFRGTSAWTTGSSPVVTKWRKRQASPKHPTSDRERGRSKRHNEESVVLRPQPCVPASGALDGAGEIFRRLRAGDDDTAAEDEAGHAVDAGFLGGIGLAFDAIDVGVAGEEPPHQVA